MAVEGGDPAVHLARGRAGRLPGHGAEKRVAAVAVAEAKRSGPRDGVARLPQPVAAPITDGDGVECRIAAGHINHASPDPARGRPKPAAPTFGDRAPTGANDGLTCALNGGRRQNDPATAVLR